MRRARLLLLALATLLHVTGCYRHHLRGGDEADAGSTRCGTARCSLVDVRAPRLQVLAPGLVGNFEGDASGLRAVPEVDGVAFELDPCARTGEAPCPTTITITSVGADLADPAVLAGAVEVSIRDRAIVVRADPCPGCPGHDAAQLLFAAASGDLSPGFDLDLADVDLEDGGRACESSGPIGERSGRFRMRFTSTVGGATALIDEGETARLPATDLAVRLVRSSFECISPDLRPPTAFESSEWVIWIEGPT